MYVFNVYKSFGGRATAGHLGTLKYHTLLLTNIDNFIINVTNKKTRTTQ